MKQSSIYQRVVEINMARSSHPWMNLFSLKMWRHRTSEKRLWHFESKNRSTAESRFGRPSPDLMKKQCVVDSTQLQNRCLLRPRIFHLPAAYPRIDLALLIQTDPQRFWI